MSELRTLLTATKAASRTLAALDTDTKNRALRAMASALRAHSAPILAANAEDMTAAAEKGMSSAMLDRLLLTEERITGIVNALFEIEALADPVGLRSGESLRPNGIRVSKMRVPLGVIAMIYEARPNVTAEAAALCLKAGNAVVLRGGSEAFRSNQAIAAVLHDALASAGLPSAAITVMPTTERDAMLEMLQYDDLIDLVIPRGGEGLIRFVAKNSLIPVIQHYKGVCHLYVDSEADLDLAVKLLIDGKVSRPSACNALESLLVHSAVAEAFYAKAGAELQSRGVEVRGCERTQAWLRNAQPVSDEDYSTEYLSLVISAKVVDSPDDAIAHIAQFGSRHTEVIATRNEATANRLLREIDASAVIVNASSRFNDGGCLGLGSEIGIATTKLHAYGPMGITSLTTEKFIVEGEGQIRHPLSPTA